MSNASPLPPLRTKTTCSYLILTLALATSSAHAQTRTPSAPYSPIEQALPDAPTPAVAPAASLGVVSTRKVLPPASRTQKTIEAHQYAPPLTNGDKILLGLRSDFTPLAVTGWVTVAGLSHLADTSPNYGTDSGAYGKRLYAAALRGTTEGIFTTSIMAPVLHQDPRYYKLGHGYRVPRRIFYAITRTFITRNDDGTAAPNYSLFAGNAAGAVLTNAYYPSQNRSVKQTAQTFGSSLAGAATGFVIDEYLDGFLHTIRIRRDE